MMNIDKSIFPERGALVSVGEAVKLFMVKEEEKDNYLAIAYEYSPMRNAFKYPEFKEELWAEYLSEESFVCSIYDKDESFVGCCYINDLTKKDWELSIELFPQYCHKGYGTESFTLMMKYLYEMTHRKYYCAKVDIDNHISQGLMKKLGACPNGISEYLLHGKALALFREENKDLITDEIREVAAEFGLSAEDVLGYVLEYRLDAEKL